MQYIDYGLGVFQRAAHLTSAAPHADLAGLYQDLLQRGELAAFEVHERFYEIGSFEGIRRIVASYLTIMSFAEEYLAESAEVLRRLDAARDREAGAFAGRTPRARRPPVHSGRGRQRGQRLARGQRFPQDLRHGGLRPTDNVSELTARTNDEGWATVFEALAARQPPARRGLRAGVLGGRRQPGKAGQPEPGFRAAIRQVGGRERRRRRGPRRTATPRRVADACVIVPTVNPAHVTPHAEAFQAVVWHLLVTHPALKAARPGGNRCDDARRVPGSRRRARPAHWCATAKPTPRSRPTKWRSTRTRRRRWRA